MRLQAGSAPSQYLSFWNSLSVHFERGGGLETAHHYQADFAWDSEAFEG